MALEFQYCYVLFDLDPGEFCVEMFVCVRGYDCMFLDNWRFCGHCSSSSDFILSVCMGGSLLKAQGFFFFLRI